jgi:hypothetical protein
MKYHISCHWRLLFLSCTMWCLHLQSYTNTSFVPQYKTFWQAKTILYVDIERLVSKIFFIQWTHQLFLIRCQTKYFFRFHTADRNNAWFAVTQSPLLWIPDWIAQGDYILGTRKYVLLNQYWYSLTTTNVNLKQTISSVSLHKREMENFLLYNNGMLY